jgi:hypothetical protein
MTTSHHFEDRLLEQLQHVVALRPAPAMAGPSRRPRRARLALAGAGVAAASVAIALVATSSDVTSSAYAVQEQPGGAVTVSIHSLKDADGLQRSLRDAGVPAVVDYVSAGSGDCAAGGTGVPAAGGASGGFQAEGFATRTHTNGGHGTDALPSLSQAGPEPGNHAGDGGPSRRTSSRVRVTDDGVTFTIDPGTLRAGEKVYITTSTGSVTSVSMAIATQKPVVACPPAPPTP